MRENAVPEREITDEERQARLQRYLDDPEVAERINEIGSIGGIAVGPEGECLIVYAVSQYENDLRITRIGSTKGGGFGQRYIARASLHSAQRRLSLYEIGELTLEDTEPLGNTEAGLQQDEQLTIDGRDEERLQLLGEVLSDMPPSWLS